MAKSIEHNIFPDLSPRAEIYEKTAFIEKSWLEDTGLSFPEQVPPLIKGMTFFKIKGARAMYEEKSEKLEPRGLPGHFFAGLYNLNVPLIYLIHCKNSRVQVYLGTNPAGVPALGALLETTLGSSLYEQVPSLAPDLPANFVNCSAITGIPTPFNTGKTEKKPSVWRSGTDCLISGITGSEWVFVVQAFPIYRNQTNTWLEACTREIKDIKEAFLLRDIQKSNRMAVYYTQILEKLVKRLNTGIQQGTWQTGIYLFSQDKETVLQGSALLSSAYSGSKSSPEPLRSHICTGSSGLSPFINWYHSQEISSFICLPSREFPGFRMLEQADFDVDFEGHGHRSLVMGQIMDQNRMYNISCSLPVDDLTKHGLIAGVTGSGKTNSVFHIVSGLYNSFSVPFLVIEPAKAEYRNLLREIDNMLVFTLGEERPGVSSPLRINPFYFPCGISLQTHIDFLKAVFNASFGLYAPMPYILEECLYKIYQAKGWNLVTSGNTRGDTQNAFPTLSDLYNRIDEVVDNIGYHDRISTDIKAALKTRINNLCIGGKGMMLDTTASISFEEIMAVPAVFELKYLGNDEEKAFMMGLILMAVWEFYEAAQGSRDTASDSLKHLLVIEEAHRLLKNVPTENVSEEQSNIKEKGVETFCNLLAEMRAYGQGVLVSEQIPVKLAPDVVKNSSLKIMHRLVAKEDRDFLGDTMSLNTCQKRQAVSLGAGEAVFFREGFDRALKIKVPESFIKKQLHLITDQGVKEAMQVNFFSRNPHLLMRFPACARCRHAETEACEKNRKSVEDHLTQSTRAEKCISVFTTFLINPSRPHKADGFQGVSSGSPASFYCMTSHMMSWYLHAKSDYHGWPFKFTGELLKAAGNAIEEGRAGEVIGQGCRQAAEQGNGRFSLCREFCLHSGLLCYEGHVLSKDPETHNSLVDLLHSKTQNFYHELTTLIADFVENQILLDSPKDTKSLCVCYLIHKLHEHQFPLRKQQDILEAFTKLFDRTTGESSR